jgi:hypothetical protein
MATDLRLVPEPKKENVSFQDFRGVNTQSSRQTIGDNEFAWLENCMPISFGNLPALPGPSAALATIPSGTVYYWRGFNLSGTDYIVAFTSTGAAYQINVSTYAITTIGTASTFSTSGAIAAQWQNTNIVIIDPAKGYFSWDGSTLSQWNGTLQSLTISAIGSGYTTVPSIGGFGTGGGSGGAATCDIQVGLAKIHSGSAGTGYVVGDVVTVTGGTFNRAAQVKVTAINTSTGAVTGISLVDSGDYTIAPGNPVSTTGGYGSGFQMDLDFGIGPITLTAIGSGYTSAPTITVTGGSGTGGAVTANLNVVPSTGTQIATYANRVWIATGTSGKIRTVVYSAPNSYTDFTSSGAGGSFIMNDETLHSSIQAFLSANNFLYVFGTDSINVEGDVNVVSGVTTFSNTNISANIGSSQPLSLTTYYRAVWMACSFGIYALYGSTAQKASDALDGIWPLLDNTKPISAGVVNLFDILCVAFLLPYNDPVNGYRSLLAIFFNNKWFFASQGTALTYITSVQINNTPTLFATDGTKMYKLFADSTYPIQQTIQTKLWNMGDQLSTKEALKIGAEFQVPLQPITMTGTLDTEYSSNSYPFTFAGGNVIQWVNNTGNIVSWTNASGQTVGWIASGFTFQTKDVQTAGRYLGLTINASSASEVFTGFHMQFVKRAQWTAP